MTSNQTSLAQTAGLPKVARRRVQQNLAGYGFIAPLLLLFAVFMGYSLYFLVKTSFYSVDLTFADPLFVGIENYQIVLDDKDFLRALLNNFLLSASSIFVALTLGFLIAVFLSFHFRGRRAMTALFFVPAMLPIAFIAMVFGQLLEYNSGPINEVIRFLGLSFLDQRWLSNPSLAMASVCSVSIYLIGIPIMYYMADLSTLNSSIFEAATIDGAKLRQIILGIIFPVLKNTHKTIALAALLGGFREMERVYLMTDGGPGGSTEIIGTYIFRNARLAGSDLGIVAAASVIILVIAFAIGFVQLRFYHRQGSK